jgi:hypothetical protein
MVEAIFKKCWVGAIDTCDLEVRFLQSIPFIRAILKCVFCNLCALEMQSLRLMHSQWS